MKVRLKKSVMRKRTTATVWSGLIFKTTSPSPAREIKVKIKIGSKNLGTLPHNYNILVNKFDDRTDIISVNQNLDLTIIVGAYNHKIRKMTNHYYSAKIISQ